MCCNDWSHQIGFGNVKDVNLFREWRDNKELKRVSTELVNGNRDAVSPYSVCDVQCANTGLLRGTNVGFEEDDYWVAKEQVVPYVAYTRTQTILRQCFIIFNWLSSRSVRKRYEGFATPRWDQEELSKTTSR